MKWEPVRDLVRREAIIKHVKEDFGQRFSDRMFTHAAKAIGFKPTSTRTLADEKQKGRVGEFDEIVVPLIASVNERCKGKLDTMDNALERYRLMWDSLHTSLAAREIPGFADDREYGAWLLMLTSPDYGTPPAQLYRRIREKPELLDLSRYGREYLKNVLIAYKEAYLAALGRMELEVSPTDPCADEQRVRWAEDWVRFAANYFAAPDRDE